MLTKKEIDIRMDVIKSKIAGLKKELKEYKAILDKDLEVGNIVFNKNFGKGEIKRIDEKTFEVSIDNKVFYCYLSNMKAYKYREIDYDGYNDRTYPLKYVKDRTFTKI